MDFLERLTEKINKFPGMPMQCEPGYLGVGESLVIYPLPGSRKTKEYMNGASDQALNFEIAMQSKVPKVINDTLWIIQTELEKLKEVKSVNDSFEFDEITITNKPFINRTDDQGWFVFLLDLQAEITVLKEEK